MKKFAAALFCTTLLAGCVEEGASTYYTASSNDGYNRVMDITNRTGVTMTHFYASSSYSNNWGPDQLGSTVLSSGTYMSIDFDDGTGSCLYDFRAVFADGDVLIANQVNVCRETGWIYS